MAWPFKKKALPEKKKKASPNKMLGAPGTPIYGGYIVEREKNPKVIGREKYLTFSDALANTPIVAAGVRFFLNLIAKANWVVEASDKNPEAEKMAEYIKEMMHGMDTSWHRVIRRAAMYRFFGSQILHYFCFII